MANLLCKLMGFGLEVVWVMCYCGPMCFAIQIPAYQVGGLINLWHIRGYGFSEVCVMRVLTVPHSKYSRMS